MIQPKTNFKLQDFFIIFIASALLTGGVQQALLFLVPNLGEYKIMRLATGMWLQDGLFILGALLIVRWRKETLAALGIRKISLRAVLESVLTGMGLYLFMVGMIQLINRLWPGGLRAQNVQSLMQPEDTLVMQVLVLLTMGVFVPIAEELIFRGVLFQSFCNHLRQPIAMLFTAICFACTHGDAQRLIPFVIGGYVLNALCVRHQSIWASAIAHGTWNSIMIIVYYMAI